MICLMVPNVTTFDLKNNENLLTSSIIKLSNLCDFLSKEIGFDTVIMNEKNDYDIVVAMFSDELNKLNIDKSKKIYEFFYDSLNGGWFIERFSYNDKVIDSNGGQDIDKVQKEAGLKEFFYRVLIESNSNL